MTPEQEFTDLAGIGIGPFNLSLAALANEITGLRTAFFERDERFSWHPGLGFRDSVLQTSYLKDMVTPVCPTSRWSFLNYLVTHGRFYDFLAGRFATASRAEFTDYMAWVAAGLPSCHFGEEVREVSFTDGRFRVETPSHGVASRAIAVGSGPVLAVPEGTPLGANCLHAAHYLTERPAVAGRRVTVVGGGQSGAEIVLDLLTADPAPQSITWVSRRTAFWHLQEGALVDQIFTPAYLESYRALSEEERDHVAATQKFSSDGLTPETADEIYRLLYARLYIEGRDDFSLRPWRDVTGIERNGSSFRLTARAGWHETEQICADLVVLATGYRPELPACLEPLRERLEFEPNGALKLGAEYRVLWDGPDTAPIYAMNHGRRSYGIIDPQLSMAAWRSARILNDLVGREAFDLEAGPSKGLVDWEMPATGPLGELRRLRQPGEAEKRRLAQAGM